MVSTDSRRKIGDCALQLGVVEHHRVSLVADERALEVIRTYRVEEVRRDMPRVELHAEGVRDDAVYLIPRYALVGGDMERLTYRVDIAYQPDVALREVTVVGDSPQGRAVAVDYDGLAVAYAFEHLPASVVAVNSERHRALVVGVARADYRHGEAVLAVLPHQILLAGYLVAGVLPMWVREGSALRYPVVGQRLLVRRRGADVDVLLRPASEQTHVALDLLGHEADELADAVKGHIAESLRSPLLVADIAVYQLHARGKLAAPAAAVEEVHVLALFGEQTRDSHADSTRAAYQ